MLNILYLTSCCVASVCVYVSVVASLMLHSNDCRRAYKIRTERNTLAQSVGIIYERHRFNEYVHAGDPHTLYRMYG